MPSVRLDDDDDDVCTLKMFGRPDLKIWLERIKKGKNSTLTLDLQGDLGSIPGRVIPKTLKMVLDTTLLNTQHYKVRFKGKVEQSWEWISALPYTLV